MLLNRISTHMAGSHRHACPGHFYLVLYHISYFQMGTTTQQLYFTSGISTLMKFHCFHFSEICSHQLLMAARTNNKTFT